MTLALINTKKNLAYVALISSLGCLIMVAGLGFLINDLQYILNLHIVQFFMVLLMSAELLWLFRIASQKKYIKIGQVQINDDYFIVHTDHSSRYFLNNAISDVKLFIKNYDRIHKKNIFGKYANQYGNYIVFSYYQKTLVYELLFTNTANIDNLVYYLEKNSADKKIEIRNN